MEPIAIVTCLLGILYIVGRGPHVVAPAATIPCYRRLISTAARIRILGILLLSLVAVPLIVTARTARGDHGDIALLIEGLGWIATAFLILIAAAPSWWQRFASSYWDKDAARLDAQRTQSIVWHIPLPGCLLRIIARESVSHNYWWGAG